MKTFVAFALPALLAGALHAGPQMSAGYSIIASSTDGGGQRATSVSYRSDCSIGGVSGLTAAAAPQEVAKSGYLGQIYEVTAVQVSAVPTTLNEATTRQLAATATLDDGTLLSSLAGSVSWSVVSGPTSISSDGLATAGNVYQNTAATVQGSYFGSTGTLGLTVRNVGGDDMGIYAGDGIDDPWQVQYFGQNNPKAASTAVSDASGLTNLFKFTAGLVPNDPTSRFVLNSTITQPGQMAIVISPRLPDRTYTVKASPTLGAGAVWSSLSTFSTEDNGTVRTITDLDANGARKFYHIEITKP